MRTKEEERSQRRIEWWCEQPFMRPFMQLLDWIAEDGHGWVLWVFGAVVLSGYVTLSILAMLEGK